MQTRGDHSPVLMIANHRTVLCWAWLWGLALHLSRLRGLRIAVMHPLKHMPGLGWSMQFSGFPFLKRALGRSSVRGQSEAQLQTLRRSIHESRDGPHPLALLVFPEGRDLNARTIQASNDFADRHDPPLEHYTQVLHPKTAGFAAAIEAMGDMFDSDEIPRLVDTTLAYVDYSPGERPTPMSVFLLGRCPREVHIVAEYVGAPSDSQSAQLLCRQLFQRKEDRLKEFYFAASSDSISVALRGLVGGPPDRGVGVVGMYALALLLSVIAVAGFEIGVFALWYFIGSRIFFVVIGLESLLLVVCGVCCGGVDRLLLWHAATWRRCPAATVTSEAPRLG
eukprot:TRINITY_DN25112_c0_g1_i1.p1 TRINITY_DN25112_c0_g1~~TRINITY_DN25112_c0_g1_i1.p1  ORF type:complete len:393 (-),score=34.29 TRINITY_DN25112_c0_g1_i1:84-1091(-)